MYSHVNDDNQTNQNQQTVHDKPIIKNSNQKYFTYATIAAAVSRALYITKLINTTIRQC